MNSKCKYTHTHTDNRQSVSYSFKCKCVAKLHVDFVPVDKQTLDVVQHSNNVQFSLSCIEAEVGVTAQRTERFHIYRNITCALSRGESPYRCILTFGIRL